jgi:hypothetical protein
MMICPVFSEKITFKKKLFIDDIYEVYMMIYMYVYAKVTFKKKRKCMYYVHMQRICKS